MYLLWALASDCYRLCEHTSLYKIEKKRIEMMCASALSVSILFHWNCLDGILRTITMSYVVNFELGMALIFLVYTYYCQSNSRQKERGNSSERTRKINVYAINNNDVCSIKQNKFFFSFFNITNCYEAEKALKL